MTPSVSSFKMHGKDLCDHVTFLVKLGLEVWSILISHIGRESPFLDDHNRVRV